MPSTLPLYLILLKTRWLLLSGLFNRRGNKSTERLKTLPRITWQVHGRAVLDPRQATFKVHNHMLGGSQVWHFMDIHNQGFFRLLHEWNLLRAGTSEDACSLYPSLTQPTPRAAAWTPAGGAAPWVWAKKSPAQGPAGVSHDLSRASDQLAGPGSRPPAWVTGLSVHLPLRPQSLVPSHNHSGTRTPVCRPIGQPNDPTPSSPRPSGPLLRQAGTWNLESFATCLHLDKHLLELHNTKKLHETKDNWVCTQLRQIVDKIQKDWKPAALLRAGSQSRVLSMPTAHSTSKGVGKPPSYPSCLTPGHTPTLTACKEPAGPSPQQASQGTYCLFSFSAAVIKPYLNFLSSLW